MKKRTEWKAIGIDLAGQAFVVLTFLSLFFLTAMCSELVTVRKNVPFVVMTWLTTIVLGAWCLKEWAAAARLKNRSAEDIKCCFFGWIRKNREIVCVLAFAALTRAAMYQNVPRGDAAEYYSLLLKACRRFDFTFRSFFDNFRLAGHPTLGYAFFMSMGEFLIPGKAMGYLLVNLILTVSALYCVYSLFQHYWMHTDEKRAAVYTLFVSCTPLFWGTFSYVNPDYNIIIFLIFMMYAESKKKILLMFFWMGILALTKETAILMLAGYFFVRILYDFYSGKGTLVWHFKNMLRQRDIWIALTAVAGGLFYFMHQGSIFAWNGMSLAALFGKDEEYSGLFQNSLKFDMQFAWNQIKLSFVLNFSWIAVLILAVAAGYHFVQKKRGTDCAAFWGKNMVGMLGGFVSVAVFLMLFQTAPLNRYHVFKAVLLIVFTCIVYETILSGEVKSRTGMEKWLGAAIFILLTAQTFFCVDPVSRLLFEQMDTGKMITLMTGGSFEDKFGDPMVNNYQYTWLDEELENMLTQVDYGEDMLIIDAGQQRANVKLAGDRALDVGWNRVKERRELIWGEGVTELDEDNLVCEDENIVPITVLGMNRMRENLTGETDYTPHFWNKYIAPYPRALVYFVKYFEVSEDEWLEYLSQYYKIGKRQETDGRRGNIVYYELTLKNSNLYPEEEE